MVTQFLGNNLQEQPDNRRPGPPRNFVASTPDDFTITCRWQDQGFGEGSGNLFNPVAVLSWFMYVCPARLAGSGESPTFKNDMLAKAHVVGSIRSSGMGEMLTLTIKDDSFVDVYVTIVARSNDGVLGIPAEPQLLSPGGLPLGNLDPVTNVAVNLTAVTDIYGDHFVDLNPSYTAPLILGRFFGVSVYAVGYLGESDPQELGNLVLYQRAPPGQKMAGHITMPRDEAHTPTTLYFVSVDRQGRRVTDYTTAPSVVLAGGIYA